MKDTAKIKINADQLRGFLPSVDTLVHDQSVIKKLLRKIGECKDGKYQYHCLKSVDMLLNGNRLLELMCDDVYMYKTS